MLRTKRPGPHPKAGSVYYWSLLVVVVTSTLLSLLRWDEDYHLFILGVASFAAASLGRIARRQRPPRLALHVIGMGTSYVLLLTAFYVDNGKNLSLWRELPQWMFWVLPSATGAAIIMYTLLRHPLLRRRGRGDAYRGDQPRADFGQFVRDVAGRGDRLVEAVNPQPSKQARQSDQDQIGPHIQAAQRRNKFLGRRA
jgi:hypothetical protein